MQAEKGVFKMTDYTFLGKSNGIKFCIEGIDVFHYKWYSLGKCDIVLEPQTKNPYSFSLYEVDTGSKKITFLAGKFSDGSWGFYKKKDSEFIF